jgi:hypothetical protein
MFSILTFSGVNISLDFPSTHSRCIPFDVPGRPIGYYAMGAHPNWTRMKEYHKFRDRVRMFANAAGLETPLRCTKEKPVIICTQAFFENGTHCDPENIRKGITDALFYTPKGSPLRKGSSDKYCFGAFDQPRYDKESPRVMVWVYLPE